MEKIKKKERNQALIKPTWCSAVANSNVYYMWTDDYTPIKEDRRKHESITALCWNQSLSFRNSSLTWPSFFFFFYFQEKFQVKIVSLFLVKSQTPWTECDPLALTLWLYLLTSSATPSPLFSMSHFSLANFLFFRHAISWPVSCGSLCLEPDFK